MFSGGVGSWAAAKRVVEKNGVQDVTLLFADTHMEDEDLYRFLDEAAKDVGAPLVKISDGRTPWDVFFDERYLGNSRIDPCSKILKRQLLDRWRNENMNVETDQIYVGIDWTEIHRIERMLPIVAPWKYSAPLCEKPYIEKPAMLKALVKAGIRPPRLYEMGFPHNNCGGFCVKAGQAHFKNLLEKLPERFRFHEEKEQEIRKFLGKDVAILKHRSGPKKEQPMTLRDFRLNLEAKGEVDVHDWGGCGCALATG